LPWLIDRIALSLVLQRYDEVFMPFGEKKNAASKRPSGIVLRLGKKNQEALNYTILEIVTTIMEKLWVQFKRRKEKRELVKNAQLPRETRESST
jgi:hypothetical protein